MHLLDIFNTNVIILEIEKKTYSVRLMLLFNEKDLKALHTKTGNQGYYKGYSQVHQSSQDFKSQST